MMDRKEILRNVKTVVIKVGTSSITGGTNAVFPEFMDSVAAQVKRLKDEGKDVLIVSSGAIGVGLGAMNAKPKPKEVPIRQAAASVGQSILMQKWSDSFQKQGIVISQILLTMDFYSDREKYNNLRNAIDTLLSYGVVPIINENDVICVKEIDAMFGDNDTLSAYVSSKMDADLLIILSDVDGLYDRNPKIHEGAKLIPIVDKIDDSVLSMAGDPTTRLGVGGMKTKLRAAEICNESGCSMIIANNNVPDVIIKAVSGEDVGTLFVSHGAVSKKSLWIKAAHSLGTIYIDDGGAKALKKHMSLLAVGIRDVTGRFDRGDVVDIVCNGKLIAKGIPDYNSEDAFKIRGLRSDRVVEVLGHKTYDDVIRSENIVLM
jgi:glutamate 5-kinase